MKSTRKLKFVILFFTIGTFLTNCTNDEIDKSPDIERLQQTVQYKALDEITTNLLSLDIYYTDQTLLLKPVVIYVHGGGWSIGDKTNQLENKINLFQSLSYIFVSINYRLSPFPFEPDNESRIKFPDHNNDVADAFKWIYENIGGYGGNKNKIVLIGHSAGAHLVCLTGTNKQFLEERGLSFSNIKGIASFDTEGYDVNKQVNSGTNKNMYINAFGTDSTQNKKASPILNITEGQTYPRFFIAKRGSAQRIAYTDEFIAKLESHGVQISQIDGSIYSHEGINNAIGDAGETLVTDPLKQFLSECFK